MHELLPDALGQLPRRRALTWTSGAFAAMFAFQTLLLSY